MSSAKSESLTSSWLIWMPFISLCCLIAEAKTFNTMLNNSGKSGHLVLFLTLGGKLCFSPLRMILALGRLYMALWSQGMLLLSLLSWGFLSRKDAVFCQIQILSNTNFFCIYWEDHMVLVLSFIDVMNHVNCFADIETALNPRYNSHLVVVNNFFNVLLDLVG